MVPAMMMQLFAFLEDFQTLKNVFPFGINLCQCQKGGLKVFYFLFKNAHKGLLSSFLFHFSR